jgi:hypothetical protein
MSAGGLSYSALINNGKITLPSVTSWGTNMNILRDPPKSITTRRINKVGETSSLTQMIQDSGDRACEAINVYARGVNPSVSVSYSNYGNNGGQRISGGKGKSIQVSQAKLPYRIIRDGAFRPPVLRQEDLLPLSRQPRCVTSAFTQKGFADFSKKLRTCGTAFQTREVKNNIIKNSVTPNAFYNIQPTIEPFEIKYEIREEPMHISAQPNISDKTKYVNHTEVDTTPYTQEVNKYEFSTNLSTNVGNTTSIDQLADLDGLRRTIQDISTTDYTTTKSGNTKVEYIHKDLALDKNLPQHFSRTNTVDRSKFVNIRHENDIEQKRNKPIASFSSQNFRDIKGSIDHGSREYTLAPKVNPGGFEGTASKPMLNVEHTLPTSMNDQKNSISKFVLNEMFQRGGKPFPG